MSSRLRVAVWLAACAAVVPAAAGAQEPAARPKAKVEFRWLEGHHVKGVTAETGIQTSDGERLSYPHKAPVLTNKDVTAAVLTAHDFSKSSLNGELYLVAFHLTDAAKKTLAAECGDRKHRELAVFVDGGYWGTRWVVKAEAAGFVPVAGFFSSKAAAERVVAAFK